MSGTVKLRSSDGEVFSVSEQAARQSSTIQDLMTGKFKGEDEIPVNVKSSILKIIVEYMSYTAHLPPVKLTKESIVRGKAYTPEMKEWEDKFFSDHNNCYLDLFEAGSYLCVGGIVYALGGSLGFCLPAYSQDPISDEDEEEDEEEDVVEGEDEEARKKRLEEEKKMRKKIKRLRKEDPKQMEAHKKQNEIRVRVQKLLGRDCS